MQTVTGQNFLQLATLAQLAHATRQGLRILRALRAHLSGGKGDIQQAIGVFNRLAPGVAETSGQAHLLRGIAKRQLVGTHQADTPAQQLLQVGLQRILAMCVLHPRRIFIGLDIVANRRIAVTGNQPQSLGIQ